MFVRQAIIFRVDAVGLSKTERSHWLHPPLYTRISSRPELPAPDDTPRPRAHTDPHPGARPAGPSPRYTHPRRPHDTSGCDDRPVRSER